jgi:hypothetical protein
MNESDARYELMSEPGPDNDAPAYWIQDYATMLAAVPGRYYASVRLYVNDRDQDGECLWEAEMLDTEAAIVLTVWRQDAAHIVARVLAALNGGTNGND